MSQKQDSPCPVKMGTPGVGTRPTKGTLGTLHAQRSVGGVPFTGVSAPGETPARRLRRLHRVWPDRDGYISYLLTICVDGRDRMLDNEDTFQRLTAFLLDSPQRYGWFGRRFVVMPDHIHLIAHQGHNALRLGHWVKALKAVVSGLKRRDARPVRAPGLQDVALSSDVGRVPSHGVPGALPNAASGDATHIAGSGDPACIAEQRGNAGPMPPPGSHEFTRIKRSWRWQDGFHDHKFRTRESESRKWEYVCLNPVRCRLFPRPEDWSLGGEIFYEDAGGPFLERGTPPLLESGILIEDDGSLHRTLGKGAGPTT